MEVKVKKLFFAWQEDAELEFLEEKAREGLHLSRVKFGSYYFIKGDAKEVVYQLDFKSISNKVSKQEYVQLYEDSGWENVSIFGLWYYFVKEKSKDGNNLIFSNNSSKKAKYVRLLLFLVITGLPLYYQVIICFPLLYDGINAFPSFYSIYRIIISLLAVLHFIVLLRIFKIYLHIGKDIKE